MAFPKSSETPLWKSRIGAYLPMGFTAENVASRYGITRTDMDQMAVDSHRKAAAAQAAGKFVDEIIPIHIPRPMVRRSLPTMTTVSAP